MTARADDPIGEAATTATLGELVVRGPGRAELFKRLRLGSCCGGAKTGSYPSADAAFVVRVHRAELPLQVALLTRDDAAVEDRDRDRERDERQWRIRGDRDPGMRERHAEVAGDCGSAGTGRR